MIQKCQLWLQQIICVHTPNDQAICFLGLLCFRTDGFGRKRFQAKVKRVFEVDAKTIVQTSVYALRKSEIITKQKLDSIYKKLGVKKDKPNPWEV